MYDRQPNWSYSDDRRVPKPVSFAILSIVLPLISLEENETPYEFGLELHAREISILPAAFFVATTRPIALSIKAVTYFGLITATR